VARKERYLVGLDVGTSKVTAVVGEMLDSGALDVVGLGVSESRGIRRGVVVNLEAAVESIKKAIDEAELMAARFCTCCRRTSSSTSRTASAHQSA